MPSTPSLPSYRNLAPLESGGVIARRGFEFQDHVAAGYCIDMLSDATLIEVWCESLDDITLIRNNGTQEEFEFVQAKSNELKQFWSVSQLCKREKNGTTPKIGSSILEKSLAYERGVELCYFRMVTCLSVNEELKVLTFPLASLHRNATNDKFTKLCQEISKKIPSCCSPNGSDTSSWLSRTVWEVRYSTTVVKNENLLKLSQIGNTYGILLAVDQLDETYKKILQRVQEAGSAKWEVDPESKKLKQSEFLNLVKTLMSNAQHPGVAGKGEKLREKMKSAGISVESIESAQEQRRYYRSLTLSSGYMDLSKRKEIEMNTQALLHQLLSQLDAGHLSDTGLQFHSRCLDSLNEIQQKYTEDIPLCFLQGYMYFVSDRCLHRFTRVAI